METFASYWPFVRGIHRLPVDSPHKGPWKRNFDIFFDLRLNKLFNKQSRRRWFETPSLSLWRHWNGRHSKMAAAKWRHPQMHSGPSGNQIMFRTPDVVFQNDRRDHFAARVTYSYSRWHGAICIDIMAALSNAMNNNMVFLVFMKMPSHGNAFRITCLWCGESTYHEANHLTKGH